MKKYLGKAFHNLLDALRDPETGHISINRAGGTAAVIMGIGLLAAEPVVGVITATLGVGVLIVTGYIDRAKEDGEEE